MSITFAVDDVTPAAAPLAVAPQPLRRLGEGVLVSHTHLAPRLPAEHHGLVASLSVAFRQHRPFLLTPDAVWLTIAQGVAGHINANSERLRSHFVRHQGKRVLTVGIEALDVADWEGAFDGFAEALAEEVGPGLARLLTCDFSTTDPVTRAASRVVLMDAFKEYFDYEFSCICGIPLVTLAGTVDDWRDVRRRVEALAEHELAKSGAQRAWDEVLGEDEVEIDGVRFLPAQIFERRPASWHEAEVVAEVVAGGWLGVTMNPHCEDVIIRAVPGVPAEEWPVVALSFLELFQRMAEEGAYFLRPGYVPRALLGANRP